MAERLVERVAQIDAANVSVAGPSQVVSTDAVSLMRRAGIQVHALRRADGRGTDEKSVVIEVDAGIVAVVVKAEFGGVALGEEILDVNVRDVNLLSRGFESVQSAVGVFLEEVEPSEIVRDAVGVRLPKRRMPGCSSEKRNPRKSLVNC